jgi:hypothetical protein
MELGGELLRHAKSTLACSRVKKYGHCTAASRLLVRHTCGKILPDKHGRRNKVASFVQLIHSEVLSCKILLPWRREFSDTEL